MIELWMFACAWKRGEACDAVAVRERVPLEALGWRVVHCEDGEDREFCPKHAKLLERPEDNTGPNQ